MNTRQYLFTSAVLSALILSGTAVAAQTSASEDIPYNAQLEGFGEKYSTYIPDAGRRDYDIVSAGFSSNFSLGCSGVPQYGMLPQVGSEAQRVFSYLQNNALGLAINYLVYRNPTLYSFLQNLNQKYSFLSQQMLASCADVRDMASKQREKDNAEASSYESKAMDACLASGQTPEHCSLGSNLVSSAETEQRQRQYARNQAAGRGNASATDVALNSISGQTRETRTVTGQSFENVIKDITGDQRVGAGAVSNSGGAGGSGSGSSTGPTANGLGTSVSPPTSDVETKIIELTEEYAEMYQSVVDSASTGDLTDNTQYQELAEQPALPRLSSKAVLDMYKASKSQPTQYLQVVAALSRKSAIATMSYILDKWEVAIRAAQVATSHDAMNDSDWDHVFDELASLRSQVQLIASRDRHKEEILSVIRDARDSF